MSVLIRGVLHMKKIVIVIFSVFWLTGCSLLSGSPEQLTLEGDVEHTVISATSTVSGQIVEMTKDLGETVKKGETIAIINSESQKFTMEQLEAVVNMKKAALEKLEKGTRPEQIQQAKAAVRAAKAKLAEMEAGTRPEQLEQAKQQVKAAKAQLDLIQSGTRAEQIEQAKNATAIAKEAYDIQRIASEQVNTTYQNTLQLFQNGYVSQKELDDAKAQQDTANKQLTTLKLQLDNAKQQLNLLQNGATVYEKTIAESQYDAALAQLKLLQNGATDQAMELVRAEVEQATAQLQLLQNGATQQELTIARSDVNAAVAQWKQAKSKLDEYSIKALEEGIIISKSFELGDVVNVGSHIADIAVNDIHIVIYVPNEYIHTIRYNQKVTVQTPVGKKTGKVSYIALEDEYMIKDKQTGEEDKPIATKVKVTVKDREGVLKPSMSVKVIVPIGA